MKLKIFQIELTNRCNATCSYCPQFNMKRKKVDMSNDVFETTLKLIDRDNYWKNFNNYVVELHSFGEALLLGDRLFYFLDRMRDENIPWSLSTNGILLGVNEELDRKLLSYAGVLEISVENVNSFTKMEDKYNKINRFLDLHVQTESNLIIILVTYGNVDFGKITGCAGVSNYTKHTWGESDIPNNSCKFLREDFFCVQSNGNIVGCCFDAEGETNYGTVFEPKIVKNMRWRKCDTCEGGMI